ncbi:unnamed protein product [Lampetra fluviatilis]
MLLPACSLGLLLVWALRGGGDDDGGCPSPSGAGSPCPRGAPPGARPAPAAGAEAGGLWSDSSSSGTTEAPGSGEGRA